MADLIGVIMCMGIGAICRLFDVPLPAPPNLMGALLVVAMTSGYVAGNYFF
ncbi:MAG: DUF1427 family protein [Bdellovibrionales bacterium]|nr:DUF1427 family protein [Bdellovibrionales bacterium]